MTSKEAYDILYRIIQTSEDNKTAHRIASANRKTLSNLIKQYINSQGYIKATDNNLSIDDINRDTIINEIKREIINSTGSERRSWVIELNKLEDNYKGSQDSEITLNIIDYTNVTQDYIQSLMPN